MKPIKSFALGVVLASYVAAPAWALTIADVPLFQSTTVSPNVVLLLDDSGSMRHIIWADGYNNNYNYILNGGSGSAEYSYNYNFYGLAAQGGQIAKSTMWRGGCESGFDKIRLDGVTEKCLKFPDPIGGDETWFVPNYVAYLARTYADGTDLTTVPAVPNAFRMDVLKTAAKSIVNGNPGMRFGIFSFAGRVGGELNAEVGSTQSTLTSTIDGLSPNSSTPLAEAYYDVTRYMRGLDPYTSPQLYRCQKNFGVVITDGLPTYDTDFPTDDPDGFPSTGDWDGLSPLTASLTPAPQLSDGYKPAGSNEGDEGYSLYLDDVAKFAYDIDFRRTGNDTFGVSYSDPAFLKQNMQTYTVGFSVANQMLQDAADYGNDGVSNGDSEGEYFSANNAAQLSDALSQAIQSIKSQTSSAAAIATNSTRLDTDTLIYQAKFNSGDWSGELIAYGINTGGTVGSERWRTGDTDLSLIPSSTARNVYTRNATTGVAFQWANLSPAQKASLSSNDADGAVVVDWLRGGSSGATLSSASNSEVLRSKTTVLGDIVNSDPVFVGAQSYGYTVPNDLLVANEPADSYQAYVDAKAASGATKTVMVGANDGMLHAFNAETGSELFAYVPSSLYAARTGTSGVTPGLRHLTKSTYTHKYYVDGSIGVGDVYDSSWKTYAVGGLGAGGRGIYALNISTPASFSASDVLWEVTAPDTNTSGNNWNDLGYTYGAPIIVRTQDDSNPWVAIFSNGYGSNTQSAALYVVNATTGAFIKKIVVDTDLIADVDNGLSAPSAIVDANRKLTAVYAGDLKGNLWKFDFSSTSASGWDVAYTSGNNSSRVSVPLFIAKNADNQAQPITSGLEIGAHPTSGLMIYFGTGKYFETSDNTVGNSPQKQSFYGIWDKAGNNSAQNASGGPITSTDRLFLRQQTITTEVSAGGNDYRVVSTNPITTANWSGLRGWYLDLVPPSGIAAGERAVSLPLLRAGRIIFTTVIPSADPCLAGGTSWLMEMDSVTGGSLNYAVLDVNGDGEFNSADKVACGSGQLCNPGGMRSREGIIKTPGIVSAGDTEYKYSGGSSGSILVITEKGSSKEGRMSWRQLR
ncbi:MAG TPA: PilC/PilY family type IV pilus protein [Pseudomonas sp.]|uniref:pilus assembly protein n=1 Tax=Pseudomonas sp. TaxID=306 RepID=UPI002C6E24EF|nr:PilC/PilY family type IV pilus protein [Pseudomonas sp.]HRL95416.1 PilC/PilY family type IV pilus protein [Pseudomonas sp.]